MTHAHTALTDELFFAHSVLRPAFIQIQRELNQLKQMKLFSLRPGTLYTLESFAEENAKHREEVMKVFDDFFQKTLQIVQNACEKTMDKLQTGEANDSGKPENNALSPLDEMIQTYQKMQKTYSIWLMPQAPLKYDGTIRIYSLQEKVESGIPLKEKEAYDKIKIATIYTSSKHEISQKYEQNDELLRVVMLLFGMSGRSVQEIRGILEKEYGFKMSDKLKKGVENMCNLAQGLIIENRAAGRMEGILE